MSKKKNHKFCVSQFDDDINNQKDDKKEVCVLYFSNLNKMKKD